MSFLEKLPCFLYNFVILYLSGSLKEVFFRLPELFILMMNQAAR